MGTPLSLFHQTNQTVKVGPYKVPPKTVIVPMIGDIMNDPEHFPNPQQFNPERYLSSDDNGELKFTPHPRVIPFGIGKRRCIGEVVARTTLYKFFTALIQRYEVVSG